ncbi:hypothetical protein ACE4RR_12995 [Alteribacillus sp. HJP-4]
MVWWTASVETWLGSGKNACWERKGPRAEETRSVTRETHCAAVETTRGNGETPEQEWKSPRIGGNLHMAVEIVSLRWKRGPRAGKVPAGNEKSRARRKRARECVKPTAHQWKPPAEMGKRRSKSGKVPTLGETLTCQGKSSRFGGNAARGREKCLLGTKRTPRGGNALCNT